jgi:hypothetical protein
MSSSPSLTDWISAGSTAVLGVLGAFITVWQWRKTGFRPKLAARVDGRRQGIELRVVNVGRASGIIDMVAVLMRDNTIKDDVHFDGFQDGRFRPLEMQGLTSMRLIIESSRKAPFPSNARLLVSVGTPRPLLIEPVVASPDIGIAGLKSVLPRGAGQ